MNMSKENMNILYHYTTMSTFYNMIEHSLQYKDGDSHPKCITMWATHYAHQNDPTECLLFFEGLKAGVLDYTKNNNKALNDKDNDLIQHPQWHMNIFTISFSKHEDDLTMWRGYVNKNEWADVKQAIINNEYAPIYKHKKYEAEGEYRIIKHQIKPQYRLADNKQVPYIKVNVPISCLKRIVVGPCQTSSEVIMRIKSFLWTKGMDIEVVLSTIPYRSRL